MAHWYVEFSFNLSILCLLHWFVDLRTSSFLFISYYTAQYIYVYIYPTLMLTLLVVRAWEFIEAQKNTYFNKN
jgi:hypothetical protein